MDTEEFTRMRISMLEEGLALAQDLFFRELVDITGLDTQSREAKPISKWNSSSRVDKLVSDIGS